MALRIATTKRTFSSIVSSTRVVSSIQQLQQQQQPHYAALHTPLSLSSSSASSHMTMTRRSKSSLLSRRAVAPPMVYISGEEMTKYTCDLVLEKWIKPYFDVSAWETYDLSCKSRDETDDQVLEDAVAAGIRLGAIFKEPTITPSAKQVQDMNLSKPLGSPNGAMRRGWNGITISRDTIHIDGIELGYKNPVLFERHAVGGEYGAGYARVGQGALLTTFLPQNTNDPPFVVDARTLGNEENVCVVYHNPYDNVRDLAHVFYKRCLENQVTPYVVTKKTVFKWQEGFWSIMKKIFDEEYKEEFEKAGLLEKSGGKLTHLISDAATMQLIRWTDGGFGMAAHNYDGDMLTDQIAQVHRSPGFITSNLVGKHPENGTLIKEFEASHGTVTDLWHDHLAGKDTSMNPLGLVEAMIGAMQHASTMRRDEQQHSSETTELHQQVMTFTQTLRLALHNTFRYGQGTRDMSGPEGFTTEEFIDKVAWRLERYLVAQEEDEQPPELKEPDRKFVRAYNVDEEAMKEMFQSLAEGKEGEAIDYEGFSTLMRKLGVAPKKAEEDEEESEEEETR